MIPTKHITIQCPQCGHTEFEQPHDVQDDDMVKCDFCGLEIKLCDLKDAGLEQAKQIVIPEAKKALEDIIREGLK